MPNLIVDDDYVWWEKPAKDNDYIEQCRANSLMEHMRALEEEHREVHRQNLFNYQLYSNRFLSSFDWGTGIFTAASLQQVSQTTDNVVLEVCDAILSEVGKARPKVKPICHGASWKTRRNARKLDKFAYGEFIRNNIWDTVGKSILLNAEVCQFGVAKVEVEETKQGPKACIKSIFPDNVLVDQQEIVATGKMWHVFHREVLPAHIVAATYGLELSEVEYAAESMETYLSYRKKDPKYVVVGSAWKIACDGTPGRKVIAIKDKILVDETWDYDWLPFVFFHWQRPLTGFYAQSLVEQVLPDQIRLNEINEVIEEAQRLMCVPRLLVQHGSKVNSQAIDNIVGKIITYTGVAPEAVTWPAIQKELYEERDRRKANAFTKVGLNQTTSSGNLPSGARLDSAPAVREYNQVQDGRLADVTQRYEKFFLELAELMIKVIKASGTNPTTVWYSGGRKTRAEKINWNEIDLEEDSYTMILEAASSFAMTPSAIRDDLEARLARGEITPEQYQKQLNQPDPDNEGTILAAAAENIDILQEQCEDGIPVNIIPEMDLLSLIQRFTLAYLNLDAYEDVPVEVYECFLDAIEQAKMWSQKGTEEIPELQAAPPSQGNMMMQPGMVPPGAMPQPGLPPVMG